MRSLTICFLLLAVSAVLGAADISGTWSAAVMLDAGSGTATFVFQQQGTALSGTYSGVLGDAKVTGTVMGDKVEWSFDGGQAGKVSFQGTLDGPAKIKGTAEYGLLGKGTFTAEKK
jgi:hypothetical protein